MIRLRLARLSFDRQRGPAIGVIGIGCYDYASNRAFSAMAQLSNILIPKKIVYIKHIPTNNI